MAKFEDYLPGGEKNPHSNPEGLDAQIDDASQQQQARQEQNPDSTPVDWEQRYKELEKLNSRQAQTLGEYRKTIDEFIADPTPEGNAASEEEPTTISWEDLNDDPNDAIRRAMDSHPEIREARKLREQMAQEERDKAFAQFQERHSDFEDIATSPEFQNWVVEDPMRVDMYQRGNQYDFSAADALFSLYKADKGIREASSQRDIEQAELVESSGELVTEPPKYSRSEYIRQLKRSKQGDLEAEDWVKANASGYREALQSGNVRD